MNNFYKRNKLDGEIPLRGNDIFLFRIQFEIFCQGPLVLDLIFLKASNYTAYIELLYEIFVRERNS